MLVQLQEADYLAAVRLHRRNSKIVWLSYVTIALYFVLGAGFLLFAPAVLMDLAQVFFGVALFLALFMALYHFFLVPQGVHRRFREQKALSREYAYSWDDKKLTIDGDDVHAGMPWTDFIRWLEDDRLFLLYSNRILFRMIPKRHFADQAGAKAFAALLSDKIAPKGKVRK